MSENQNKSNSENQNEGNKGNDSKDVVEKKRLPFKETPPPRPDEMMEARFNKKDEGTIEIRFDKKPGKISDDEG